MANTKLECTASGTSVITSNVPGCRGAVIDGVSGFFCEAKAQYAFKMKKLTEESIDERDERGLSGRKHVEPMFDKRKAVEETIRFLIR
jgi:galacturonosyltransferase